jgi:hypothetical protein
MDFLHTILQSLVMRDWIAALRTLSQFEFETPGLKATETDTKRGRLKINTKTDTK